jgi:hypothetical protein
MDPKTAQEISRYLGWLMLVGIVTLLPLMVVDVLVLRLRPGGEGFYLLARLLFAAALVGAGALALIRSKRVGFFIIYFASLVSFWAWLVPYIPVPQKWLPFAEKNCLVTPALNAVAILLLGWAQISLASENFLTTANRRLTARVGIFLLAAVVYLGWRAQYQFLSGQTDDLKELPAAGQCLESLTVDGPIKFRGVKLKAEGGLMLIFTGKATKENFLAFAEKMKLTSFPSAEARRFLKLAKQWRLDAAGYATTFGESGVYFSGRISGTRSNLQICQSTETGDFTGQIIAAHFFN